MMDFLDITDSAFSLSNLGNNNIISTTSEVISNASKNVTDVISNVKDIILPESIIPESITEFIPESITEFIPDSIPESIPELITNDIPQAITEAASVPAIIASEQDNSMLMYFGIGFIVILIGIFVYKYYTNKHKQVRFQENENNICYDDESTFCRRSEF
jgi:hypothetical protein